MMRCQLIAGLLLACLLAGHGWCADANTHTGHTPVEKPAMTLEALLLTIKQEREQEKREHQQREQRFLRALQEQEALLKQARHAHSNAQQGSAPLKAQTETNQQEIQRLRATLQQQAQDLGDMQAAFRSFAGDFSAALQQSMVTPARPQRTAELERLASLSTLPTLADVESLWMLVQEEMTLASIVQPYQAAVVDARGALQQTDIVRAGTFTSSNADGLLRYLPETGELLALSKPPAGSLQNAATDYLSAPPDSWNNMVLDPTHGSLLGMMSYSPSVKERIEQAGTIGWIIIGLGVLGALIALWRMVYLGWVTLNVKIQLRNPAEPKQNNPLGRVLFRARDIQLMNTENIQLKLDEAILAELPTLEQGQNFIKLLAAVAPLLGLLGTVTGMILTFQSISLFGNGDPKLMAGGISQALMTTVLGLIVAIPLLFGHHLVAALSRNLVQRLDEQSAGILARSIEQQEST